VPPPLHTLKIWGSGVSPCGATGPSLSFLFVCPSRYDARHRKPRRCVYALNLGGTGISPPDKRPRAKDPPDKSTPGQKSLRPKVPPGKKSPGHKTPRTKISPAPDTQQAATYSIAAVAGNWTILVSKCIAWYGQYWWRLAFCTCFLLLSMFAFVVLRFSGFPRLLESPGFFVRKRVGTLEWVLWLCISLCM